MNNIMVIDGYRAVVQYDPEIDMFRGEFLELNGGADFYAADVAGLRKEGLVSLRVFLEACREAGISPVRVFSGKFQARVSAELHLRSSEAAAARGISLNQFVQGAMERELLAV
ncbi:type II toxin-antitoxin system HicB family antitoxin [Luteibacter aegosomaticola]|uniref:type II toxin-antitoxin system HicB family antitoxin n=1 Tax=Luteibacter aegosomaticola TaxID=2911538 RepID=UPI001FFA1EE5|nr:type II toxin-antitoxin system HicB family antitoxin [Luteibacter aegosomaticola]UPG91991.1 type II toxin-antitoxin system HicB family antitoxin [Luteibacter aegosomaticola]